MNTVVRPVADPAIQMAGHPKPGVESNRGSVEPENSREWSKLCTITLRHMDKFIDLVPLVLRGDDSTAVNRMRVTCRRLEQMLELVYVKPRPRYIRKLKRRLKLYRRTLGKLRNCDALLALCERALASNPPEAAAWVLVRDYLRGRRSETARTALEKLGHVNVAIPYLRIKRDLTDAGAHDATAPAAAELVRQQIASSLRHRWREFETALEKSQTDPCQHVIHRARIAAKRLRYLAEVMSKLHMAGSAEALSWLKILQGTIGIWHDLEILEGTLHKLLAQHDSPIGAEISADIERLIAQNREIKNASAHQFFAATRQSDNYQQVRMWVAGVLSSSPEIRRGRRAVASPVFFRGLPAH